MPLIYTVRCEGVDPEYGPCKREDLAQFTPERGYFADGWHVFEGHTFCSYVCLLRHVSALATLEVQRLIDAVAEQPVAERDGVAVG